MRDFVLSVCAVLQILALAGGPAMARDMQRNSLEDYTVTHAIITAPGCTGDAFEDQRIETFERGVCEFHRPARSAEDLDRALNLLRRAQVQGLPVVHQQFATLLTGLGNCEQAEAHLAIHRASLASGQGDLTAQEEFCLARAQSQAELNALRWNHAMFEYEPDVAAPHSLDTRLGEMAACYSGVLAPGFDAECGLITNITETELNVFVDEATEAVVQTYFSGVESPITAMFQRKRERAEGVLEMAEASIDGLAADAGRVNAEHDAYSAAYQTERDAKMAPIYDQYRDTILRATAILDEFARWKEGLFLTGDNVNLLPRIVERGEELTEELDRVAMVDYSARASALVAGVRSVVQADEENRALTRQLCRIYYCELVSRRRMLATQHICRQPEMAGNPLCLDQTGSIKSGTLTVDFGGDHAVAVADLCRAAGIDDVFLTIGLLPSTAQTCMSQMPWPGSHTS